MEMDFGGLVIGWLRSRGAHYIAEAAMQGRDLAHELLREYPPAARRFALGMLGTEGVARLRSMGEREFDAILTRVMVEEPPIGQYLWPYRRWFLQQLALARDLFLEGA